MASQGQLRLLPVVQTIEQGWVKLCAQVERSDAPGENLSLFVSLPEQYADLVNLNAHIFLPACMVYAMQHGYGVLAVEHVLDDRTRYGLEEIQRAYLCLFPHRLKPVEIQYGSRPIEPDTYPEQRGRGVFFSAGVDAFHAALTVYQDPLLRPRAGQQGYLLAIQGYDTSLEEDALFEHILHASNAVSRETGWHVVHVRTNMKEVLYPAANRHRGWTMVGYASCMQAVVNALSRGLERVYIASGVGYMDHMHSASNAAYDHLWSSPMVELVNIGSYATRIDKLKALPPWKPYLKHLKVCGQRQVVSPINCGWCEKCKRTILSLYTAGLLDAAQPAFPPQATGDMRRLARTLDTSQDFERLLYEQIADCLDQNWADKPIAKQLRCTLAIDRSPWRRKIRGAVGRLRHCWRAGMKRLCAGSTGK